MERLRLQADQRALEAQRQRIETRLVLDRLERERAAPSPVYVDRASPPVDPAAASRRHDQTRQAVGQIDAWLDRGPQ